MVSYSFDIILFELLFWLPDLFEELPFKSFLVENVENFPELENSDETADLC